MNIYYILILILKHFIQVKMKSMKSHDERIRKMFEKAKKLSENQVAVTETSNVDADVKTFFTKWENLYAM